jgi:glyoxylase-like metal-dependent hydrolase (beta-lactamase superfamily II)
MVSRGLLVLTRQRVRLTIKQLKTYPLPIIGGKDCSKVSKTPAHGETFNIGDIKVKALHTPCHTQDSICFLFEDGNEKVVFTGDTLFIGGKFQGLKFRVGRKLICL